MTTEIVGLEQHGFVADITCRAGKLQFISQTGFGIRSGVQMNVADTTQQLSASGESEFSAAENIGVCACDGNTPESSTVPPAITELRIKSRRDRSCLFFIISFVIQFDNTYFLQPCDNPFISRIIRSPTNLYALKYS